MNTGYFSKEFLQSIPSDNLKALVAFGKEFRRFDDHNLEQIREKSQSQEEWDNEQAKQHDDYIEALAIFTALVKTRGLNVQFPPVGPTKIKNIETIQEFLRGISKASSDQLTKRTASSLLTDKTDQYSSLFKSEPTYEFSDVDVKRIQELVNELRDLISTSSLITPEHKRRLLGRLEAMQGELHKYTSDIDRFWGFFVEAGIVARKFGEDLKPISDRVTELGKIVIAAVMAKEGVKALPDITKLLNP